MVGFALMKMFYNVVYHNDLLTKIKIKKKFRCTTLNENINFL